MSASSPTQIAYCADTPFALPLAVSLRSLSRFHTDPVVVANLEFEPEARRRVERAVPDLDIEWLTVPRSEFGHFPTHMLGPAAFSRLLLPRLLPDVDRILYIDGDTLVAAPLDELLGADLGGNPLGAVQNLYAPYVSSANGLASWQHHDFDPRLPYFNSGVLVLDAAQWRDRDLESQTGATVARLHGEKLTTLADQDALNVQFAGEWTPLPYRFNQHPAVYDPSGSHHHRLSADEVTALRDDPAIVHFIGRNKPWKATAVHPRTAEWRSLVSTDAFPGWQPETRSTGEKIRGRLRKGFNGLLGR